MRCVLKGLSALVALVLGWSSPAADSAPPPYVTPPPIILPAVPTLPALPTTDAAAQEQLLLIAPRAPSTFPLTPAMPPAFLGLPAAPVRAAVLNQQAVGALAYSSNTALAAQALPPRDALQFAHGVSGGLIYDPKNPAVMAAFAAQNLVIGARPGAPAPYPIPVAPPAQVQPPQSCQQPFQVLVGPYPGVPSAERPVLNLPIGLPTLNIVHVPGFTYTSDPQIEYHTISVPAPGAYSGVVVVPKR